MLPTPNNKHFHEMVAAAEKAEKRASGSSPAPGSESSVQRLTDLLRYQRAELHQDGLITDEEYAALCSISGSPARLESYDDIRERLAKCEARLKWLHDCSTGQTDPEGYEWGIYRVKWENGRAVDVRATLSDLSDLDAEMARELQIPNTELRHGAKTPTREH